MSDRAWGLEDAAGCLSILGTDDKPQGTGVQEQGNKRTEEPGRHEEPAVLEGSQ